MTYLKWNQKTVLDFSNENTDLLYDSGYVFGRIGHGIADQTRSLRIDLWKFELTSENRRIIKKTEGLTLGTQALPYQTYNWEIGKMGKDFYDIKFGEKTFSANKIKELMTDSKNSNFNKLLIYKFNQNKIGYTICRETEQLLHYCYPFYNLTTAIPNLGLGMMIRAILWAKETNKRYIYLGSAQRPSDTYKLQFEGIEWFDGSVWKSDLNELKEILTIL